MDLTTLSNKDLAQLHADVKGEITDRVVALQEALDPPKGRGRPPTNGMMRVKAADLEPADGET